jgi:hypothetical protein
MERILVYVEWLSERRLWRVRCNPKAPDWAKKMIEEELRHKATLVLRARASCIRVAEREKGRRVELFVKKRNRRLGAQAYAHTVYGG